MFQTVSQSLGDAIVKLQTDNNASPPSQTEAFDKLMNKLAQSNSAAANTADSGNATSAPRLSMTKMATYSAILAVISVGLSSAPIQAILTSTLPDLKVRMAVQAFLVFILCIIVFRKF